MAPLTRAQMKQLAEDALRAVQEWVTAIPRDILKKLFPESLFYVLRPNPLWQLRRFTIGKLGQTNKANLQILNERRGIIISRFARKVTGTRKAVADTKALAKPLYRIAASRQDDLASRMRRAAAIRHLSSTPRRAATMVVRATSRH